MYLFEIFSKMRVLFCVLTLILLMCQPVVEAGELATGREERIEKRRIIREVIKNWVEIGAKQYERGFYEHAKKSLYKALEYEEYLTAAEHTKINELLKSKRTTPLSKEQLTEYIQTAQELIEKGDLLKAASYLEKIKDDDSLTKSERRKADESLGRLYKQIKKQQKDNSELYKQSVGFYGKGQLEKAREGFVKVARSKVSRAPEREMAEDYLMQIDAILLNEAKSEKIGVIAQPVKKIPPERVKKTPAEPVKKQKQQVERVSWTQNIQHSYTKAVVGDVVSKVQDYMSQGKFYKAQEAVEGAVKVVNENRIYLGDELFGQYSQELKGLSEAISSERKRWLGNPQGVDGDKK